MTWAQSGLIFQKTWGSIDNTEVGNGVALDSLGNIYVTGYTYSFGPGNLTARPALSLLKYDSTGTLVWQRIWSGNGSGGEIGSAVAVDSSGNIYVTGWTSGYGAGMSDILLLKFNSSGSLVWQRTYGGSDDDQGSSVAVDSSGNIYVTGGIREFGAGSDDVLLLKFDPSGNLLWQRTWGGIHLDYGSGVAVDSSDHIYVAGTTASFGTGLSDVFLLRFDSSGDLAWQKTWGPHQPSFASGNGVAVDSSGSIYVTGYFGAPYDILLLKFDSSGSLIWQRTWDGGSWDYGEDVAVDSSGGIYVGGYISAYDVLLLRFDSLGNHAGQVTWGGNEPFSEHGNDVAVDSSGNAVMTGFVEQSPPFTPNYPKGTIDAPFFTLGVPSFTLDTPTFLPYTPMGTVQTPFGSESNIGSKVNDAFLVKFTPLDYTENYTENPGDVFGLPPIAFYGLIGGAVVLIVALTTILLRRRRKTVITQPTLLSPPSPPAQT